MSSNAKAKLECFGTHMGLEYAVLAYYAGHRCGYVRVPDGHPWINKAYQDLSPDVHGGLTFSCTYPDSIWELCKFTSGGAVFGFDCNHAGDELDYDIMSDEAKNMQIVMRLLYDYLPHGAVRTTEYVKNECLSLVDQIARESNHVE